MSDVRPPVTYERQGEVAVADHLSTGGQECSQCGRQGRALRWSATV